MSKELNELFYNQTFYDYSKETENNLPVGLKILETQAEGIINNEEKIQSWVSCYGLKTDNFPIIEETYTKVSSEINPDSSYIIYHLPYSGDEKFFDIKPNGDSYRLKCTIDKHNKVILTYYPVIKDHTEDQQRAEISEKNKVFVAKLKESLLSLKIDLETFNNKVEVAIRTTIDELINKNDNNQLLVNDLQSDINRA